MIPAETLQISLVKVTGYSFPILRAYKAESCAVCCQSVVDVIFAKLVCKHTGICFVTPRNSVVEDKNKATITAFTLGGWTGKTEYIF